ncbi:MAG: AraC family transcriptional regulator, partial [Planctomycetota bacterium]
MRSSGHAPSPIPLIHQAELQPLFGLLAAQKAPIGELLARAKLPGRLQEPDDGFVPARFLLGFMATGARYLDREDFSFQSVLRAPGSHVGSWGPMVSRCWRLRDALQCFCIQLVRDAPFLEAGVRYGAEHAWLWRRRELPPKDPRAEQQGALFTLASMLRIVRMVAGDSWNPPAFRAEAPAPDWLMDAEGFGEGQVSFGGSTMAIAVPYELLDLRMPRDAPIDASSAGETRLNPARDFAGSLQQALMPFVAETPVSLELGAEIAEVSPRTLRRRLDQEGTSWRRVLDRARFEACERLMLEPSLTLTEIAAELGYADQAHFTRAFRRWAGESPSSYRRRRLSGSVPSP